MKQQEVGGSEPTVKGKDSRQQWQGMGTRGRELGPQTPRGWGRGRGKMRSFFFFLQREIFWVQLELALIQPMPCFELCLSHGRRPPKALEHLSEGGLTWEGTQRCKGWQKGPCPISNIFPVPI